MTQELTSAWQTEKLAQDFLEGVRGAVPGTDMQLAVIGKIADQWCAQPQQILDPGCIHATRPPELPDFDS
ncbi:MAG: hypothetical protein AAGH78_11500 [Cyanobacteria bacterium P01_H01_bin.58]